LPQPEAIKLIVHAFFMIDINGRSRYPRIQLLSV
jgi:hypothetical protein